MEYHRIGMQSQVVVCPLWQTWSAMMICDDASPGGIKLASWQNERIEFEATDYLYLPKIQAGQSDLLSLGFNWAYKRSFSPKHLSVEVSYDCGLSFEKVWERSEQALATVDGFEYENEWIPQSCDDWNAANIRLESNGVDMLIRFVAEYPNTASFGQPLYLHDICLEGTNSVFPVELLTFEGKNIQEGIMLNWETAWEINNQYFEVQRRNGIETDFKALGRVEGMNKASAYSFIDKSPGLGANIYKLKQVDLNGVFTYSEQIEVFSLRNDPFIIFPNPANSSLQIQVENNGEYHFRILDINGREILNKKGFNAERIPDRVDISILVPGIYLYEFTKNGTVYRGKWIKGS